MARGKKGTSNSDTLFRAANALWRTDPGPVALAATRVAIRALEEEQAMPSSPDSGMGRDEV